jgi:deoxycytidylate deaminase
MTEDFQELATGYNGPAAGEPHCIDHPCAGAGLPSGTGLDMCEAIHAEMNAIAKCADVKMIHTAYVTHSPCSHPCVKMLMNTGCERIVFAQPYAHDHVSRDLWTRSYRGYSTRSWEHIPMNLTVIRNTHFLQEVLTTEQLDGLRI